MMTSDSYWVGLQSNVKWSSESVVLRWRSVDQSGEEWLLHLEDFKYVQVLFMSGMESGVGD